MATDGWGDSWEARGLAGASMEPVGVGQLLASCLFGYHFTAFFRLLKENYLPNWLFSPTSCNEAKLHSEGA